MAERANINGTIMLTFSSPLKVMLSSSSEDSIS